MFKKTKVARMLEDLKIFLTKIYDYQALDLQGIHMEFVDYQEELDRMTVRPIILNDRPPVRTKEDRAQLQKLLRTDIEGDTLNIIPSCSCGKYHKVEHKYRVCEVCHTEVRSITEQAIESNIWIRSPKGVAPLMNPTMWLILKQGLSNNKFSVLDWLVDPRYIPKKLSQAKFAEQSAILTEAGFRRGYNNFYEHHAEYLNKLLSMNYANRQTARHLSDMLEMYGHLLFTTHLPVPNKLVFLTEKSHVDIYADSNMRHALEAAQIIAGIDESDPTMTVSKLEYRTVKVVNCLAEYASLQFGNTLGKKEGIHRKEMFGTRMKFAARSVISSITEPHNYDEIHLPWGYAIGMLKTHLSNKLMKMGMTIVEINRFLMDHVNIYHPLIDQLFKELIEETGLGGLPCVLQRNPTLARGSAQCFFISKVKTDPADITIGMSVLVLAAPNADFDGKRFAVRAYESIKAKLRKFFINLSNCFELPMGQLAPKSL